MKDRFKNIMYEHFIEVIEQDKSIELDGALLRKVANRLAVASMDVHDENHVGLSKMHGELVLTYERNRTQFIGMIKFIEKSSKFILDTFKKETLVKMEYSALTRKTQLKSNTTVLTDVVKYFNHMNDLVIKFYSDVYEIEKVDPKETDIKQTSLF
jgi:transcription elongation factor